MNQLPIHDIKPLVEIPDYSLYIFIALIALGVALLCTLAYFIYKAIRNKEKSLKKESYKILQNIDLTQSKRSAYLITHHARILISTPREKKLFEELNHSLEQYKYKKEVQSFDEVTQQQFELFMDAVDVK